MAAQDELKKAQDALNDPMVKSYTYKGKQYSLTELRDKLIPQLRKVVEQEQKSESEAASIIATSNKAVRDAEARVKTYEGIAVTQRRAFAKGNISEIELEASEQRLADSIVSLNRLKGVEPATETVAPVAGGRFVAPTPRGVTPGQVATTPTTATTTTTDTTTPPSGTTTTTTTTNKGKKGGKKPPTPTGTGPLGLTAKARADLIKQYPQFASSFDGGEGEQALIDFFGQDLVDLWIKVATSEEYDLNSEAGAAVYLRDLENTAYGQRTTQAQQDFDVNPKNQAVLIKAKQDEITKSYADLQLTQTQLQEVAKEAARNGTTGDALRFAVYNYAYKGNQVTATESALADQIRNAGKAYGHTVSEDKLKAALTGTPYLGRMVTQESLLQEAQAAAKGSYGHLADQIDSGLTLEDIFYNYRMFASRTLGIDPNEIDFMKDSKWADAFGTKDTGQLSLNDWTRKLKTDDKYGWQFSDEANQTATKLVADMEKAFGFRK